MSGRRWPEAPGGDARITGRCQCASVAWRLDGDISWHEITDTLPQFAEFPPANGG